MGNRQTKIRVDWRLNKFTASDETSCYLDLRDCRIYVRVYLEELLHYTEGSGDRDEVLITSQFSRTTGNLSDPFFLGVEIKSQLLFALCSTAKIAK